MKQKNQKRGVKNMLGESEPKIDPKMPARSVTRLNWAGGTDLAPSAWHMNRFERSDVSVQTTETTSGDLTVGVEAVLPVTTPDNPVPNNLGNPKLW